MNARSLARVLSLTVAASLPLIASACGGTYSSSAPRTSASASPAARPEAQPAATIPGLGASASATTDAPPASAHATAKQPPKTIIARHVLVQWMGCRMADTNIVRTREQAKSVIDEAMGKLRAGVPFARVVADYSDEPNSAARGGSLGRFGRGVMDPSFEAAAFALAPGERSGVVESPFGFHIIERIE